MSSHENCSTAVGELVLLEPLVFEPLAFDQCPDMDRDACPKAWNSLADLATCPGTAASLWSRIALPVCWLPAQTCTLLLVIPNPVALPEASGRKETVANGVRPACRRQGSALRFLGLSLIRGKRHKRCRKWRCGICFCLLSLGLVLVAQPLLAVPHRVSRRGGARLPCLPWGEWSIGWTA